MIVGLSSQNGIRDKVADDTGFVYNQHSSRWKLIHLRVALKDLYKVWEE